MNPDSGPSSAPQADPRLNAGLPLPNPAIESIGLPPGSWRYSLALGATYLGLFHLWMQLDRNGVLVSTLVATAVLLVAERRHARRGGFINGWDRMIHASVILDLMLEGWLIHTHDTLGFHLCALAFALVIVGYRRVCTTAKPVVSTWSPTPIQ